MLAAIAAYTLAWSTLAGTLRPAAAGPRLDFTQTTIDLGDYVSLAKAKVVFPFVNRAGRVVELRFEQCSLCDSPETDHPSYGPDEPGTVTVTFNPDGRTGPVEFTTTVWVPDAPVPKVPLRIKANIRPRAWIVGRTTSFDAIEGVPASATIFVAGRGEGFTVRSAEFDPPGLLTVRPGSLQPMTDTEPSSAGGASVMGVPLSLDASPSAPIGEHEGVLRVQVADDQEAGELTASVRLNVRPGIVAEPIAVLLGRRQFRSVVQGRFTVRRADGMPIIVRSVDFASPDARRVWSPALDVVYQPGLLSAEIVATCMVPERMSGSSQVELVVRVEAEGPRGPATIDVPVRFGAGF
jgi:hypothetical protein